MSFTGTTSYSVRLHHSWTEFQCLNVVTRVLHEFTLRTALVSPLPDLSHALLSPGTLNVFQFLGFIKPLVDSRLLRILFLLPWTFYCITLPAYLGLSLDVNSAGKPSRALPYRGLTPSPLLSDHPGLILVTQFWNHPFPVISPRSHNHLSKDHVLLVTLSLMLSIKEDESVFVEWIFWCGHFPGPFSLSFLV